MIERGTALAIDSCMMNTNGWLGLLATITACSTPGGANPPTEDAATPSGDAAPFTLGVSTLAGVAEHGDLDGDRSVARFSNPVNALLGADGLLYVADFDNGRIRTIDHLGNVATLISQTGFKRPFGMAWSASGTLYVQTDNDATGAQSATAGTIWSVDVSAHTATVLVGGLGRPRGLAVLADGRIAMADDLHDVIEILDPRTKVVTVLAGVVDAPGYIDATGAAARFSRPYSLAVRADGKLVVSDYSNHRIRLVDVATGAVTTLAGTGAAGYLDGSRASALFNLPRAVAIDASGDIYVTEAGNFRVRRIRGDVVETVAGNGIAGYIDADDRLAAERYGLEGMAVSSDGTTLYIADGNRGEDVPYNRLRLVDMTH